MCYSSFRFVIYRYTLYVFQGHFYEYWIPCFVQCDALKPRQLRVKCIVREFSATVTYADEYDEQWTFQWHEKYCIAGHGS